MPIIKDPMRNSVFLRVFKAFAYDIRVSHCVESEIHKENNIQNLITDIQQ